MFALLKRLLLASGLALASIAPASAATVTFNLFAPVSGGPLDGLPLTFDISYDDAFLIVGNQVLGTGEGLAISSDGQSGLETVDVDFPDYPRLTFVDFVPTLLDFLIDWDSLPDLALFGIAAVRVGGDVFGSGVNPDLFPLVLDPTGGFYVTATTIALAPVPLPAGLPLLAGGLGLIALAARRRAA